MYVVHADVEQVPEHVGGLPAPRWQLQLHRGELKDEHTR
jgi:hypothetical protein